MFKNRFIDIGILIINILSEKIYENKMLFEKNEWVFKQKLYSADSKYYHGYIIVLRDCAGERVNIFYH